MITDNEEIKRVNTEFRSIGAPTDVLSFPMIPFKTPADYSVIEGDDSYFDLDTDELILGDVMISVIVVCAGRRIWTQHRAGIQFLVCTQYAASARL